MRFSKVAFLLAIALIFSGTAFAQESTEKESKFELSAGPVIVVYDADIDTAVGFAGKLAFPLEDGWGVEVELGTAGSDATTPFGLGGNTTIADVQMGWGFGNVTKDIKLDIFGRKFNAEGLFGLGVLGADIDSEIQTLGLDGGASAAWQAGVQWAWLFHEQEELNLSVYGSIVHVSADLNVDASVQGSPTVSLDNFDGDHDKITLGLKATF